VLGNTGNAYTVTISQAPSCTCPDSRKGNVCKHRLFVLLRVLRRPRDDPVVWQKALLSSELQELLGSLAAAGAPEDGVLADPATRTAFALLAGPTDGGGPETGPGAAAEHGAKQRELEGDCPVCYEPFAGCAEAVVFCHSCGNNIHKDCFEHWRASKVAAGRPTCVLCRAPWIEPHTNNPKRGKKHTGKDEDPQGPGGSGQYLNLAPVLGGTPGRTGARPSYLVSGDVHAH